MLKEGDIVKLKTGDGPRMVIGKISWGKRAQLYRWREFTETSLNYSYTSASFYEDDIPVAALMKEIV